MKGWCFMKKFSDNPQKRLLELSSLSLEEQKLLYEKLTKIMPSVYKPKWPFGMPSSIMPLVVILALSPGGKGKSEDKNFNPQFTQYDKPTFGTSHAGFYPKCAYWRKVRELCYFLIKRYSNEISENEALALSAHLNFSTEQNAKGSNVKLEKELIKWISQVLKSEFQAKIIIAIGLFEKANELNKNWDKENGLNIDWNRPEEVYEYSDFENYKKKPIFRIWHTEGKIVIMIPHPNRHPFRINKRWEYGLNEIDKVLAKYKF